MTSRKNDVLTLVLTICLIVFGSVFAFSQEAETEAQLEIKEYEGIVKVAVGRYLYIPEAQGLDIYVAGSVEGGLDSLVGKEVKVKASLIPDKPNLVLAESIEIKEGTIYRNVFTRTAEPEFTDYFSIRLREEYEALNISSVNRPSDWEGKTKVKVYGKVATAEVEGSEEQKITHIIVTDDKGKEIAKVIVNNFTDYAKFYLKKLRLFDHFWFYLNVNEQVDRRVRTRTREIFSADVVFCGLY
ncbi:MAG: hypothetical protein RBR88_02930 [Candidatus Saccharicenans sp.]|nr:hypothetical protein [Candidatus Saccharicenans sp.]